MVTNIREYDIKKKSKSQLFKRQTVLCALKQLGNQLNLYPPQQSLYHTIPDLFNFGKKWSIRDKANYVLNN